MKDKKYYEIKKNTFDNLKFDIKVKISNIAGYIVPCNCGDLDCTGEKIIYITK